MKITEALSGEHGVFYAQFDHLEQAVLAAPALEQVQSQVALLAAALATHASLEDELLFSTLDPYLGPMGPLAVMRTEHDEIERVLNQVQEVQDVRQAQQLILHAVQVARGHFAREEQILFPMARQVLDENTLAQLGAQWAGRRGVITD